MDERETRSVTLFLACFSLASIGLFLLVYAPTALSATPGTSLRAMAALPLIVAVLAIWGWVPAIAFGIRQLLCRPRTYGVLSICVGILHFLSYRIAQWLLMDSRGIHWGQ